jgi:hypothetical protein
MTHIWVSETLIDEVNAHPKLTVDGTPFAVEFDDDGSLLGEV